LIQRQARWGLAASVMSILAVSTPMASPAAAADGSFFDGFDTLSSSRWYISDGWANGAHQSCAWSKNEISASEGMLKVGFTKAPGADNRDYTCGEIQTRTAFSYGTYEARFKTPKGSGLNAAFFSYIAPPKAASHDEIDFEVLLKDTSKVQTGGFAANKGVKSQTPELPKPSDSDFIDYAFVWAPGSVKYYLDGKLVHTVDDPAQVQTQPQRIYFSLWSSDKLTDWMGPFADPGTVDMQVDWVAYTAPGDKCLFPQSITCAQ
jgi:endo-1,3-1,4-beta-glycanase ExoK